MDVIQNTSCILRYTNTHTEGKGWKKGRGKKTEARIKKLVRKARLTGLRILVDFGVFAKMADFRT